MKRRWIILLVLTLGVLLVWAFLLPHGGYRRSLEAYKQELISKGEKLSIAELAPPRVPNLSPAAGMLSSGVNLATGNQDLPTRMRMVAPGRAQMTFTNITPALMLDYERNTNGMAALRAVLDVKELEFDPDYSRGIAILLPHEANVKRAQILAVGTAMQALNRKDYDEARADLITAADIVRLFKNDHIMISDLVRIADAAIAFTANWEALEGAPWTNAQLAELQAKWEDIDLFQNAERDLAMDRAIMTQTYAQARGREASPDALAPLVAAPITGPAPAPDNLAGRWYLGAKDFVRVLTWKSSWSFDEELFVLQSASAAKETARHIVETSAAASALAELHSRQTNINQLHRETQGHFILSPTADEYVSYLDKLAEVETARRIQVAAIALKRYQLRHGAYPATLSELVPEFLSRVPIDFMDGKPLRYRLKPDGEFLLYSVGMDGVDNGGDPSFTTASPYWIRARDIVWPRPATGVEIQAYEKTHPVPAKVPPLTNAPPK